MLIKNHKELTEEEINNLLILDRLSRTVVMLLGGYFIFMILGQPVAIIGAVVCGLFGFFSYK